MGGPIAPEWDQLAELQRALGALDSGGDASGVVATAGRGVRLRLARMAVESLIRADNDHRARRRREEFERALAGFARETITPPIGTAMRFRRISWPKFDTVRMGNGAP